MAPDKECVYGLLHCILISAFCWFLKIWNTASMLTAVRRWVPPVIPPTTTQHFRLRTPAGNIHVSVMRWASCVLLAARDRTCCLLRFKRDMIMRNFRPPQRCTWGLRSSGMLRSFKVQAVRWEIENRALHSAAILPTGLALRTSLAGEGKAGL